MAIRLEPTKLFSTILISFAAIQAIFLFVNQISPGTPIFKGGTVLLLMLAVVGMTTLFNLGIKITELNLKRDGIFILLVLAGVVALFIYLPQLIPQIFSINTFDTREFLTKTIGSAISLGQTGVAG